MQFNFWDFYHIMLTLAILTREFRPAYEAPSSECLGGQILVEVGTRLTYFGKKKKGRDANQTFEPDGSPPRIFPRHRPKKSHKVAVVGIEMGEIKTVRLLSSSELRLTCPYHLVNSYIIF